VSSECLPNTRTRRIRRYRAERPTRARRSIRSARETRALSTPRASCWGIRTHRLPSSNGESIAAEPGAVTALVGPNGSGKSTLLKGLATQLAPDDGSVLVDGRDVHAMDTKGARRKLGLLSQESTSPNSITVDDLVYHGRYPHRGFFERTTDEDARAVEQAIELAGCGHLLREREVGSLSGGQKQLAWIAMVLAQETDVLLLDEPTTFLDLHHQMEVMEIIETLRDESDVTVVVVLHDIEQAPARGSDGRAQGRRDPCPRRPEEIVTEDLLADVFRVDADVVQTENGPRVTRFGRDTKTQSRPAHGRPSESCRSPLLTVIR